MTLVDTVVAWIAGTTLTWTPATPQPAAQPGPCRHVAVTLPRPPRPVTRRTPWPPQRGPPQPRRTRRATTRRGRAAPPCQPTTPIPNDHSSSTPPPSHHPTKRHLNTNRSTRMHPPGSTFDRCQGVKIQPVLTARAQSADEALTAVRNRTGVRPPAVEAGQQPAGLALGPRDQGRAHPETLPVLIRAVSNNQRAPEEGTEAIPSGSARFLQLRCVLCPADPRRSPVRVSSPSCSEPSTARHAARLGRVLTVLTQLPSAT